MKVILIGVAIVVTSPFLYSFLTGIVEGLQGKGEDG